MALNEEYRRSKSGVFFARFQKAMEATRKVGALYYVCPGCHDFEPVDL
jgi:hypothetical protein